jgi:uncharacterized protein
MQRPALTLTALLFAIFITVGAVIQSLNAAFGIWFTEIFIFFGIGYLALARDGHAPLRVTGLVSVAPAAVVVGLALGVLNFFAAVVPLQFASHLLSPPHWREMFDSTYVFKQQTQFELVMIVASVAIAAPVCEEFFFRGILQRGLVRSADDAPRAIVISAFVFSAFHLDPVGFFARFELGLLFGWLYFRTGSLWPGIIAHSTNNLVATLLYFLGGDASEAKEEPSAQAITLSAVFGLVALVALWRFASRLPVFNYAIRVSDANEVPPHSKSIRGQLLIYVATMLLSVGALVAIDYRGVRLGLFDATHGNGRPSDELIELKKRARRGEISLQEYFDAQRSRQP